ncbi:SIMPL domain-containing protein [Candidatus Solirubrobacter pratensis]|uniref:SIMPL domain-containing protein n=1 Tax=Candidatus Solirubrobacter pratensis TaxID=1298857 RepID=UPI0012DD71D6|nr:SIMPL domain-containing protein [Candidatus Solirubrobacter pratensis]
MRWQMGLAAAVAAGVLAPAAHAQAPAKSVTTIGAATVKVKPQNRKSSTSIAAAVEAADASARPKAVAEARERAAQLAQTGGLVLGAITSISDAPTLPYYGPFGIPYPLQGTFGPGKYCGTVRTVHRKRGSDGRTRVVRGKPHRVCRVPASITVSLTVTFAAS